MLPLREGRRTQDFEVRSVSGRIVLVRREGVCVVHISIPTHTNPLGGIIVVIASDIIILQLARMPGVELEGW